MKTPLRIAREKRGLTIQDVANSIGIDQSNISRIERCGQAPKREVAEKLAEFFKGDLTELQILYPERYMSTEKSVIEAENEP